MNLIGIAGKIGTGKSVLMSGLAGDNTHQTNFGDILKREVAKEFNFDLDLCYSMTGKSTMIFHPDVPAGSMTVRSILQWYGTDVIRKNSPNHWVTEMDKSLDPLKRGNMTVIIGDVRFPNEANYINNSGGKLIRLLPYQGWNHHSEHQSETALDDYDGYWLTVAPPYGELGQTAKYIRSMLNEK